MTDGQRSRWARYRDRKRGGPPRQLDPHGSLGAVRRHQRASEDLCDECAPVWSDHKHAAYLRRKGVSEEEIEDRLRARAAARVQ